MRQVTLIYCWDDGERAKALAAARRNGENYVFVRDAREYRFKEDPEVCDHVAFTDNVPDQARGQIADHYKAFNLVSQAAADMRTALEKQWTPPARPVPTFEAAEVGLSFRHVTQGRWYVFRGKTRVSGPHTKDEAKRLAQQGVAGDLRAG